MPEVKKEGYWVKLRLSHEEVHQIADHSSPFAALAALEPSCGSWIAAGLTIGGWALKKADEQFGKRGLVFIHFAPPWWALGTGFVVSPLINAVKGGVGPHNPDKW